MRERPSHVLIIGGTSGIGLATAERLAGKGARVTVVGRDPGRMAAALRSIGPSARGEAADASDRSALDGLFGRLGSVDHLVLAASGGSGAGAFGAVEPAALRRGFEGKFWVYWNATQAALPNLATDGSIVFVTAASSRLANPGRPASPRSTARLSGWCRCSPASSRRGG